MKINQQTQILGEKVILVPYEKYHVPNIHTVARYHEWMKSVELQKLTASEPISLDEEYRMQKSWREDEDKCTFIILRKGTYDNNALAHKSREDREIESMVGDVNLFLDPKDRHTAEAEIMIAEPSCRGQGQGKEALCFMLRYGISVLGVKKYVAKIGLLNEPSIRLFSHLGFQETSRSEVFEEITMELPVTETVCNTIISLTPAFCMKSVTDIK